VNRGAFDLAIIDLDLPPAHGIAEDGWELVRILRAADPTLLMVLIAAECHPDTRAEALRHGAAYLLEKPISPRELRGIVRTLRPETTPV
jgi:DNA-binding response OmpR family regulator